MTPWKPGAGELFRVATDRLGWEYVQFEVTLTKVLAPFHEAAVVGLQKRRLEEYGTIKQLLSEAQTTEQALDAEWEGQLKKDDAQERERFVGWLTLAALVMVVHLKLNKLKSCFDSTHPPDNEGYKGKSWLDKLSDEYNKRFGIKLDKNPAFGLVKVLVLARNVVEHNGGKPTVDYRAGTGGRFLAKVVSWNQGEQELVVFSNQDFKESVRPLKEYMDWLVRELMLLRDGVRPEGPLRSFWLRPYS